MSWSDLIIGAIVLLSFAGPAVGKIFQALKKQREKEMQWRNQATGSDMDDVAEQRRRELMRQRQQQSSRVAQNQGRDYSAEVAGSSQVQPQQPAQPGNMTMAERIARARAKAEYERRAKQLGQQPQQAQAPDPAELRRTEAARAAAEREREIAEARQRQQAQQQREAQVQRQRAEQQAQARKRKQQQRQSQRRQQQIQQQRAQRSREAARLQQQRAQEEQQRRRQNASRLPSAYAIEPEEDFSVEPHHIQRRLSTRKALREAIVLREILDKPVSMRPSSTEIG